MSIIFEHLCLFVGGGGGSIVFSITMNNGYFIYTLFLKCQYNFDRNHISCKMMGVSNGFVFRSF